MAKTAYAYDARNRMTTIAHKDGSTVLDGWTYSLDDQGNITRTDQADGSYWTYGYDGRYRLTTADRYEASGSSIRAQYAYGYDLADNLTAKTEPFLDDFEDGNYTGWSSGGGWSATTKVLKENYSTATRITRNNGQNDVDIRFRYMTTDTTAGLFGEMCFRTSSTNALTNNTVLRMSTDGMKLQKVVAGVVTVLDNEPSATATANTWYRVRILAKGSNVTVWRGEGDDGPMEEVLSSTAVPTLTTVSMWFISGANSAFAYDDIELDSVVDATAIYGYDPLGRRLSKTVNPGTGGGHHDVRLRRVGSRRGTRRHRNRAGQFRPRSRPRQHPPDAPGRGGRLLPRGRPGQRAGVDGRQRGGGGALRLRRLRPTDAVRRLGRGHPGVGGGQPLPLHGARM